MALVYCRECGSEVSTDAVVCPKCGAQNPAASVAATGVGDPTLGQPAARPAPPPPTARDPRGAAYVERETVVERRPRRAGSLLLWVVILLIVLAILAWYMGWFRVGDAGFAPMDLLVQASAELLLDAA